MLSDKLLRILRSKSSFSPEQLAVISEQAGWAWVYANTADPERKLISICFTGYADAEKADLSAMAKAAGMNVCDKVRATLSILCVGATPGPSKLAQAQVQRIPILTRTQFEQMLETGEIPGG